MNKLRGKIGNEPRAEGTHRCEILGEIMSATMKLQGICRNHFLAGCCNIKTLDVNH